MAGVWLRSFWRLARRSLRSLSPLPRETAFLAAAGPSTSHPRGLRTSQAQSFPTACSWTPHASPHAVRVSPPECPMRISARSCQKHETFLSLENTLFLPNHWSAAPNHLLITSTRSCPYPGPHPARWSREPHCASLPETPCSPDLAFRDHPQPLAQHRGPLPGALLLSLPGLLPPQWTEKRSQL